MTLETYQILFTVFFVLTILFFILSIVFFFVFDIRKIFSIKTGRAVRKSVRELNEINRNEDNRRRKKYKGHSVQLSKELTGDFDSVAEEKGDSTGGDSVVEAADLATVPLEIDETVVLKDFNESVGAPNVSDEIENMKKSDSTEKLKTPLEAGATEMEKLFRIIDKKEVVFSNEIIPKR